jgi:hypothetical protein
MQKILGLFLVVFLLLGCSGKTENCSVKDPDLSGKYYGECLNGFANGSGEAIGRDIYAGKFKSGLPDGNGTYKWGAGSKWEGDIYVGSFENGERVSGEYKWKNGIIEKGSFYKSKLNGFGSIFYPSSDLIMSEHAGKVMMDGGGYLVTGYWREGNLGFRCASDVDCDRQWNNAVAEIEVFLSSNRLEWIQKWAMDFKLQSAKCGKKFQFKTLPAGFLEECLAQIKSPYKYIILLGAEKNRKTIFNLNEVKAGLVSEGQSIVTGGLGTYIMGNIALTSSANDASPVMVEVEKLDGDTGLALINKCSNIFNPCRLIVFGAPKKVGPLSAIKADYVISFSDFERLKNIDWSEQAMKAYAAMGVRSEIFELILK